MEVVVKLLPGRTMGLTARVPVRDARKLAAILFGPLSIVPVMPSVNSPVMCGPLASTVPRKGQFETF